MQLKTPMDWISPITPTWPVCHGQTEKMRLEPALLLLVWAVGSQAVCERFLVPSPRGHALTALLNIPAACKQGGWFWNRGLLVAYSLNYLIQGAQIPAVGLALELFLRKYFWALSWASCICKLFILVPCSHCIPMLGATLGVNWEPGHTNASLTAFCILIIWALAGPQRKWIPETLLMQ